MKKKPEKKLEETFDEAEYYEGDRSELGGEDRDEKESKDASSADRSAQSKESKVVDKTNALRKTSP